MWIFTEQFKKVFKETLFAALVARLFMVATLEMVIVLNYQDINNFLLGVITVVVGSFAGWLLADLMHLFMPEFSNKKHVAFVTSFYTILLFLMIVLDIYFFKFAVIDLEKLFERADFSILLEPWLIFRPLRFLALDAIVIVLAKWIFDKSEEKVGELQLDIEDKR